MKNFNLDNIIKKLFYLILFLLVGLGIYSLVSGVKLSNKGIYNTTNPENLEKITENINENIEQKNTNIEPKVKDERIENISIKAVGDILYHSGLQNNGKQEDGSYDFSKHYKYISEFMKDADLTIGNFESTYNPNKPYSSYPMFNVPKELLQNLKDIGFDALSTVNNHSLDTYYEGLFTTIDAINEIGLVNFGTQKSNEDKYKILKIKDIKIALLAYTTTLNGMDFVLDTYDKKASLNKYDMDSIKSDIDYVRNKGADIVIIYPHWGSEYVNINSKQYINDAREMIELGADAVLGNHPHVVLQSEEYTSKDGRTGFILHSFGNFISAQRLESLNDIRTEQSVVVNLVFEKNFSTDKTILKEVNLYPTWVRKTIDDNGTYLFQVGLAKDFMEGGKYSDDLSASEIKRATQAYEMTNAKLKEIMD